MTPRYYSSVRDRWAYNHIQTKAVKQAFLSSPIYDNILSRLEPGDSIRLAKTCHDARAAHADFLPRGYNIDKLLRRYFDDPDEFRRLQARTATLISGSSALQFLDRSFYKSSDLDLYTPRQAVEEVWNWILSTGYFYKPTEFKPDFHHSAADLRNDEHDDYVRGTDYKTNGICAVYEFQKGDSVVQLIAARHSPFHAIISFHSTIVMNFITYEAAYSLYPKATFDARIGAANDEVTDKELEALNKYRSRGWAITTEVSVLGQKRMKSLFLTDKKRWVLDRHAWRVPLKSIDIPPRSITQTSVPLENDPAIVNSWKFTSDHEISNTTGTFVVSTLLKYRYMFGDDDLAMEVIQFLARQGKLQYRAFELEGNSAADTRHSDGELAQYDIII
ncbi:hypothetical protein FA15DRAFT_255322 [Coprinopsis marcescibilis]|uniref:Uncharacterized protein n=1 Tax=Coprinopsis marcescibilis TaxID=230819 RepID=A0A5C3LE75_COPMA|nr:hypothetical protein FA15DRAFT_255322 [Coprinopsis marcescibilis]